MVVAQLKFTNREKIHCSCRLFVSDTGVFTGLALLDPHLTRVDGYKNVSVDHIVCIHNLNTQRHTHTS